MFDKKAFMKYMLKEFSSMDTHFTYDMVENLVDWGLEHQNSSKDQFCYWLSDLIPEVEFEEVARFMSEDYLTSIGKGAAKNAKEKAEEPKVAEAESEPIAPALPEYLTAPIFGGTLVAWKKGSEEFPGICISYIRDGYEITDDMLRNAVVACMEDSHGDDDGGVMGYFYNLGSVDPTDEPTHLCMVPNNDILCHLFRSAYAMGKIQGNSGMLYITRPAKTSDGLPMGNTLTVCVGESKNVSNAQAACAAFIQQMDKLEEAEGTHCEARQTIFWQLWAAAGFPDLF